jgi:DNA-binding MarR family transcriptional regulator
MQGAENMDQLGRLLKRTQHKLHLLMSRHLQPYGLTVPQYAVLTVIQNMSPISGAELSREVFVTPQTMHTLLKNLEQKQLIERTVKLGNAKSLDVCLTIQGSEILGEATKKMDEIMSQAEINFNNHEVALFKKNLTTYEHRLDLLYESGK